MKGEEKLRSIHQKLRAFLTKGWGLKLVSFAIALVLWFYVLYSNPNLTRNKTVSGVNVILTGQTTLASRGLCVSTDLNELPAIRAKVSVPYGSYGRVTGDRVTVEMDISAVRKPGTAVVRLRGSCDYGKVVTVYPETVEILIESQDQRNVPLNVVLTGEKDENTWYNVTKTNPSQLSVTGPASLIQDVSSAQVRLDVTEADASFSRTGKIVLLNGEGGEIESTAVTKSTSSATVGVDVYPTKQMPLSAEIGKAITGTVPDGYEITDIEISPNVVTVAGDATLLDALDEMQIDSVDVTGADKTFTKVASVTKLKDLKYLSTEQVNVTITVEEVKASVSFANLTPDADGLSDGAEAQWGDGETLCAVVVTGPAGKVNGIEKDDIRLWADVNGLRPGTHEVRLQAAVENRPELVCEVTPETMQVTILEK